MGYPVHKFLEEFDAEHAQAGDFTERRWPPPKPTQAEAASTERADAAYTRGYEAGKSSAEARLSAELAALHAEHAESMERSRALLGDGLAEKLASELRRQIAAVHVSVSDQIVSALLPLMHRVLTEASMRELAEELGQFLNEAGALTVELRGPQELMERVRRRLTEMERQGMLREEPRLKCVVDEVAELRATANDTVIEARVMDWIRRISAAVE